LKVPAIEETFMIFPFLLIRDNIYVVNVLVPKKFVLNVTSTTLALNASPLYAIPALFNRISNVPTFYLNSSTKEFILSFDDISSSKIWI